MQISKINYAHLNNKYYVQKPNNPKVKFKGISKVATIPNEHLNIIESVIKKCEYSKKGLIASNQLKFEFNDNLIYFKNFYKKFDTPERIEGVCEELTYKVAKILKDKLGDKYEVIGVNGLLSDYGMLHNYLALFKKTPEQEEKLANLIDNSRKVIMLENYVLRNQHSMGLQDLMYAQMQMDACRPRRKEFENALLIDPSFNTINDFNSPVSKTKYTVRSIYNPEEMQQDTELDLIIPRGIGTIPAGLVKNICPELIKEGYSENDLICFNVKNIDGKAHCDFEISDKSGYYINRDFIKLLPPDHLINKFLAYINKI